MINYISYTGNTGPGLINAGDRLTEVFHLKWRLQVYSFLTQFAPKFFSNDFDRESKLYHSKVVRENPFFNNFK